MARRALLAPLLALLAAACSPAGLLNAVAPRRGLRHCSALAYAPGPRGGVDVYAPAAAQGAPVVVFFYGGGWEAGERGMYRFLGAALAEAGLVCLVPDYRVWPEVGFPGFVQDGARAVAWARAHAAEHGGNPEKLFLMGHSAGAHIATMLALNPAFLAAEGLEPRRALRGVVGLAGPYDFVPLQSATLRAIFGAEAEQPLSQPINFVAPGAPPMLLATGTEDPIVLPRNTARLAARLREAGNAVEEISYAGVSHAAIVGAFAAPLGFIAPVKRDVLRFIGARA